MKRKLILKDKLRNISRMWISTNHKVHENAISLIFHCRLRPLECDCMIEIQSVFIKISHSFHCIIIKNSPLNHREKQPSAMVYWNRTPAKSTMHEIKFRRVARCAITHSILIQTPPPPPPSPPKQQIQSKSNRKTQQIHSTFAINRKTWKLIAVIIHLMNEMNRHKIKRNESWKWIDH